MNVLCPALSQAITTSSVLHEVGIEFHLVVPEIYVPIRRTVHNEPSRTHGCMPLSLLAELRSLRSAPGKGVLLYGKHRSFAYRGSHRVAF